MDIVWQPEDCLRERKVESDLKDLLKTMVAFANSVAPGDTAQIFIGENDDGTVQGVTNSDNIQKKVRSEFEKIYPEIFYRTYVYERDGKQCVRVDIQHNGLAPHFGGAAWVRRNSETHKTTEQLFQQMIDLRSSLVRDLMRWLDKTVTVSWAMEYRLGGPNWGAFPCLLVKVTARFCTFRRETGGGERSEPTDWLTFSWDDQNARPRIYVNPTMVNRSPW
jgi:hypothetical protein